MSIDLAQCFWQSFEADSVNLAEKIYGGKLRDAFEGVEAMLDKSGFAFSFELTLEEGDAVLILTPEGDKNEAARIDCFAESRPHIKGWRIYTRRQRKSLHDAFAFVRHIYGLDIHDATFDLESGARGFKVKMYSGALTSLTVDEIRGLVETFLDHAVGEAVVMAQVFEASGQSAGNGHLAPAELIEKLTQD